MNLPDTSMLNFFNKVLITLSELSPGGKPCSISSLIELCRSVASGGQLGEYVSILRHCQQCGLIQLKNDKVYISTLGQSFLDANREHYFEITEAQKNIIVERVIFKGALNHFARDLFNYFSPNYKNETYEYSSVDTSLPTHCNSTVHLLKHLGVLQVDGVIIRVNKKFSELVYEMTADTKAINEQQLEKMLMENRKLGVKAEKAVVEFEKLRLERLGKHAHAALVKRISTINTAAGYDIESFDGTTSAFEPDRFIEVKATLSNRCRFYWSSNEIKIAKGKKNNYWIYLLKDFKENKPSDSILIMIQNPEHIIPKHDLLSKQVSKYLISEIGEIKLEKCNIEEVIWYCLT